MRGCGGTGVEVAAEYCDGDAEARGEVVVVMVVATATTRSCAAVCRWGRHSS